MKWGREEVVLLMAESWREGKPLRILSHHRPAALITNSQIPAPGSSPKSLFFNLFSPSTFLKDNFHKRELTSFTPEAFHALLPASYQLWASAAPHGDAKCPGSCCCRPPAPHQPTPVVSPKPLPRRAVSFIRHLLAHYLGNTHRPVTISVAH